MFIDTHAHLHVREFDHDRDAVIQRAAEAGVSFISVGFEPAGNQKAALLAEKFDVPFTAGIHPHHANECTPEALEAIEELRKKWGKGMVAVGELGLDYYKNFQPRDLQIEALREQLILARKLSLPVIVHCRDAFDDAIDILMQEKIERAVFHCFSGSLEIAKKVWSLGFYTSFTGVITYPSADMMRTVLAEAPVDRIMLESDCPFLAPVPHRGKRNEPALLTETAKKAASVRNVALSDLERSLQDNTQRFFICKF